MNEVFVPKINSHDFIFPDPKLSPSDIVAWGGDLNTNRLINAYQNGIFPWFNENDPILWWSPNPRCILYPNDMKISKSLKKSLQKYKVTYDQDFAKVIESCKDVREQKNEKTWIIKDIIKAYNLLHVKGFAHSVEVWSENELVGGLYGVLLGKVFCGESMFAKKADASKVALANLCKKLSFYEFDMIDCQVPNPHLLSLGAITIPKNEFLNKLEFALQKPSGFENFAYM